MNSNAERNQELDFLRGASVLGVVAIHISALLIGKPSVDNNSFWISLFINQISRFSVPTFLFVSGFLAFKSLQKKSYISFLKSKIHSLLIPYITWTILGLILVTPNSLNKIIIIFITGYGAFSQLYYIPLLFQCILIMPFLVSYGKSFKRIIALLLITIVITCIYEAYLYFSYGDWLTGINVFFRSTLFLWLLYFILGILFSQKYHNIKKYITEIKFAYIIILLIGGIILEMVDCYFFMNRYNLLLFLWFFRPSVIIYSLICILTLLKLAFTFESRLLNKIYHNSFGIYLSHFGVLLVLNKYVAFLFSNIIGLFGAYIITIIISYIITEVIKNTPLSIILLGKQRNMKKSVIENKLI